VADGSGGKVEEIYYYPYGETRTDSAPAITKHKYTGQEWDGETGLYYYRARYYHPVIGRFISADTVVPDPTNPQGLNRYSNVLNNPLRYIDPTGHYYEWRRDGNNVVITLPVMWQGLAAAVPEVVDAYYRQIESAWSGQFGQYNVILQITTPAEGAPRSQYNVIEIGPLDPNVASGRPFANEVGGNYAKLGPLDALNESFSRYLWLLWTSGHEVGHLLGLPDSYNVRTGEAFPGEKGIMAAAFGVPEEKDISNIVGATPPTGVDVVPYYPPPVPPPDPSPPDPDPDPGD
jgi:RHS repeat-associated protein